MGQRKLDCRWGQLSHPSRDLGEMNRRQLVIPGPEVEASPDAVATMQTIMMWTSSA